MVLILSYTHADIWREFLAHEAQAKVHRQHLVFPVAPRCMRGRNLHASSCLLFLVHWCAWYVRSILLPLNVADFAAATVQSELVSADQQPCSLNQRGATINKRPFTTIASFLLMRPHRMIERSLHGKMDYLATHQDLTRSVLLGTKTIVSLINRIPWTKNQYLRQTALALLVSLSTCSPETSPR